VGYCGGRANKVYVQVTLNCNMACRHCCYSAGPDHREFMSQETFEAALKLEPHALLNIGGGEPTCHPLFWNLMAMALRTRGEGQVWLSTNGKRSYDAMVLAEMVRKGEIRAVLSQDKWHEPISPTVVEFWRTTENFNGKKVIRDVGSKGTRPIGQGRCDWGLDVCNGHGGPWVMWDGSIRQCGCLDAPVIGSVYSGYEQISGEWGCWAGRLHPDKRHLCEGAKMTEKAVRLCRRAQAA